MNITTRSVIGSAKTEVIGGGGTKAGLLMPGLLASDVVTGRTPVVDPQPFRYGRMVDGTDLGAPAAM